MGTATKIEKTIGTRIFLATVTLCAISFNAIAFFQSPGIVAPASDTKKTISQNTGSELPRAVTAAEHLPAKGNFSIARKNQVILFEALPARTVGDPEFVLEATASSGLPISFSSSNPQVAVVQGDVVKIKGGGTAFLSASQAGNDMFYAAPMIIRLFTVDKLSQTIRFDDVPKEIEPGTAPFLLGATATSGLPVTFMSSNPSVIRIDGNRCTIVGTGNASISSLQFGNSKYDPAFPITYSVSVNSDSRAINESVSVLPNPIGEWMFIGMDEFRSGEPVSVEIVDSLRNSVIRMTTQEQEQLSMNVATMSPGVYYLELTQKRKKVTSRFVKL